MMWRTKSQGTLSKWGLLAFFGLISFTLGSCGGGSSADKKDDEVDDDVEGEEQSLIQSTLPSTPAYVYYRAEGETGCNFHHPFEMAITTPASNTSNLAQYRECSSDVGSYTIPSGDNGFWAVLEDGSCGRDTAHKCFYGIQDADNSVVQVICYDLDDTDGSSRCSAYFVADTEGIGQQADTVYHTVTSTCSGAPDEMNLEIEGNRLTLKIDGDSDTAILDSYRATDLSSSVSADATADSGKTLVVSINGSTDCTITASSSTQNRDDKQDGDGGDGDGGDGDTEECLHSPLSGTLSKCL